MKLLVVVAVAFERDAIIAALPQGTQVDVVVGGAGPASAAAGASLALSREPYDLVISAGIGGGFAPLGPGAVAIASSIVFADLGAQTPAGFVPASALGFGEDRYEVPARLSIELADRTGGHLGTILTVATVTGTAQRAEELLHRHPDAVAEAMEGAGVAAAARAHGIGFAEVRAISNVVGPRDREAWKIAEAAEALATAIAAVAEVDGTAVQEALS